MRELPSKSEILNWIRKNPGKSGKRDIARAFGIKGAGRVELKVMLRDLQAEGQISREKGGFREKGELAPVTVLEISRQTADGDLIAQPITWDGEGERPDVLVIPKEGKSLGMGDRVLARISKTGETPPYEARPIKRIGGPDSATPRMLGIYRTSHEGGRIVPVDKKSDREWAIPAADANGAKDGELVIAEKGDRGRAGLTRGRIVERLGDPMAPKAFSLIAIHQHGIPDHFPDEVIAEADAKEPAGLEGRTDLRDVPLVTIDPSDARHYVTPGSELDREARNRGNSSYFPDRVVPMLPDRLSGDLCSLHEGVSRACIAVRIVIDAEGNKLSHEFMRGLMKSPASLNYTEVQQAMDGNANDKTEPFVSPVLRPLYAAYAALKKASMRIV